METPETPFAYVDVHIEMCGRGMLIPVSQKFHWNSTEKLFDVRLVPSAMQGFSIWITSDLRISADRPSCSVQGGGSGPLLIRSTEKRGIYESLECHFLLQPPLQLAKVVDR